MRATAKSCEPKHSSAIKSISEEKEEEDNQEGGWMKPTKFVPIVCFCNKFKRNNEKDASQ